MIKKLTKEVSLGITSSVLVAALLWLFRKTISLTPWQLVSLCLFIICILMVIYVVNIKRKHKKIANYVANIKKQYNKNQERNKSSLRMNHSIETKEYINNCVQSFSFLGVSSKRTMSSPEIQKKLTEIGRNKGKIKILLLNPDSEYVSIRAKDEMDAPEAWISDIKATIDRLKGLALREHIEINIRLYDQYPVWRIAILDNKEQIINFFLKGQQGPQSKQLCIKNNDLDIFNAFQLEFDRMWESAIDA